MSEIFNYINKFENEIREIDFPVCSLPYELNDYEKGKHFGWVDEIDRDEKERDIQESKTADGFKWSELSDDKKESIIGNTLLDFLGDYLVYNWMDDLFYKQQIDRVYQDEKLKSLSVYNAINIIGVKSGYFKKRT